MNKYFADLHIHIGRASDGSYVKITASDRLNFASIAVESLKKKGLDLVGIIDCASPPVINDIEDMLDSGDMEELEQGGICYRNQLVIIPGAEVESREDNGGQAHYLAYFPHLYNIREFSTIMEQYITNINLSSQSTGLTGNEILQIVESTGGILIPAHAFTPHKSFYGNCFASYKEIFSEEEWSKIHGIELGLSADTELADFLCELESKTFLSNSDAHSLQKIAREYNLLEMNDVNFNEFKRALLREDGRRVSGNYGLDPKLGKYHRSYCRHCDQSFTRDYPVYSCPECDKETVTGVKDRILKIADKKQSSSPPDRPLYIHQVPLLDIPGIGSRTLEKLLDEFGTEMNILHRTELSDLEKCVSTQVAQNIITARNGKAEIEPGGGGKYGRVIG